MVVQVGAINRPDFEQHRPQSCYEVIVDLVKKVTTAVIAFFTHLFNFIFCIQDKEPPTIVHERELPGRLPIPHRWNIQNRWEMPAAPLHVEPLIDAPVDLEALRIALREGRNPQISTRMTPADFTALCEDYPVRVTIKKRLGPVIREVIVQETQMVQPTLEEIKRDIAQREGAAEAALVGAEVDFPRQRTTIAEWATMWANARHPKVDPSHPYFPIVQAAFLHRNEIDGGADSSDDYTTYSPVNDTYYDYTNKFTYTILGLIGFQELSRPENIALFHKLDNWSLVNGSNPAYIFATAASKIYTYPKAIGGNVDVRQKLQNGLGSAWAAYESARAHDRLLDFFEECFTNENCFDARVMKFQEFNLHNMHPNFDDFIPGVVHGDRLDTKVTRYFAAFYHEQIQRYITDHPRAGITYVELKTQLRSGIRNIHSDALGDDYINAEQFAFYLERNNQPIRERTEARADLPRVYGVRFEDDRPFLEVIPVDLIPEAHRVVGREIALQRWGTWYKAKVHRVEANRINLDLRGDPIPEDWWRPILEIAGFI